MQVAQPMLAKDGREAGIDEKEWGWEAKSGLCIFWNLNPIRCPSCQKKIDSRHIRYKLKGEKYINFCIFCNGTISRKKKIK